MTENDFAGLRDARPNSVRVYRSEPDTLDFTRKVAAVFRFAPSEVPDLAEIAPKLKNWIDTTSQSLGNWISREEVRKRLERVSTAPVRTWKESVPTGRIDSLLALGDTVTLVAFDTFQTPVARISFRR